MTNAIDPALLEATYAMLRESSAQKGEGFSRTMFEQLQLEAPDIFNEYVVQARCAVRAYAAMQPYALTNTAILCFVLGYQGGTVHQVAKELGVTVDDIIGADSDKMGILCRMAQRMQWKRLDKDMRHG